MKPELTEVHYKIAPSAEVSKLSDRPVDTPHLLHIDLYVRRLQSWKAEDNGRLGVGLARQACGVSGWELGGPNGTSSEPAITNARG
ncbi:UNVERIFIED_CONTAM: hypothetical protein K2H54_014921 [Gekko kuhli]